MASPTGTGTTVPSPAGSEERHCTGTPAAAQYHETSYQQQKEWLVYKLSKAPNPFNIQKSYWHLELDVGVMERVLGELVVRHESLRTTFVCLDGEIKQRIEPYDPDRYRLHYRDLSGAASVQRLVADISYVEANYSFDLEQGPLLRMVLLRLPDVLLLLFTVHHVVADVISLEVLEAETAVLYDAFREGRENPLPGPAPQYKDYVRQCNQRRETPEGRALQQYWRNRFSGPLPVLTLAPRTEEAAARRQAELEAAYAGIGREVAALGLRDGFPYHGIWSRLVKPPGAFYRAAAGQEVAEALNRFAGDHHTTLFVVLLACYYVLLHKLSGSRDIIVDIPVSTRDSEEVAGIVGWLTNGANCRMDVDPALTLESFVKQVQQTVLEDVDHKGMPVEEILEAVGAPLPYAVQAQLSISDNTHDPTILITDFEPFSLEGYISFFELKTSFSVYKNGILVETCYGTSVMEKADAPRMSAMYLDILECCVYCPTLPIAAVAGRFAEAAP